MSRRRFVQAPKKKIEQIERAYPTKDPVAQRLRARTTFGSIEEIEEKRFPWLKKRREQRPPKMEEES